MKGKNILWAFSRKECYNINIYYQALLTHILFQHLHADKREIIISCRTIKKTRHVGLINLDCSNLYYIEEGIFVLRSFIFYI